MFFTAPTVIAGTTITSYDYEISTDGGTSVYDGPISTTEFPTEYGNTGATSSPYTDPYALNYCTGTTTCSYRIRAEVGASAFQSPWSDWVTSGLPLQVSASPSTGAAPLATTLTLTASDPSGEPLTYSLAFGDGSYASGTVGIVISMGGGINVARCVAAGPSGDDTLPGSSRSASADSA